MSLILMVVLEFDPCGGTGPDGIFLCFFFLLKPGDQIPLQVLKISQPHPTRTAQLFPKDCTGEHLIQKP